MGNKRHFDDPKTLVPTSVLEARVDTRLLAMLAKGMYNEGIPFRTKSELVRNGLEWLHNILVQNGLISRYETIRTDEAIECLARFGLVNTNRSGRNFPTLTKKILAEQGSFSNEPTYEDLVAEHIRRLKEMDVKGPAQHPNVEQPSNQQAQTPEWLTERQMEIPLDVDQTQILERLERDRLTRDKEREFMERLKQRRLAETNQAGDLDETV